MRILIFSWFFPPTQTIGALRVGKFARFLHARGHDVRVIACADMPFPQTLELGIPAAAVTYTPWTDINDFPRRVARWRNRLLRRGRASATAGASTAAPAMPAKPGRIAAQRWGRMTELYELVMHFPDSRVGWLRHATRAGHRAVQDARPDLIYASGPPFTGLLAASRVAGRAGVPLVLEFRDRWVEDPYAEKPRWRCWLEKRVQDRMIKRTAGIVTVSEPWATTYRQTYDRPVATIYNGFDPADYGDAPCLGRPDTDTLHIVYTGGIYPNRRDPTPLFQAIAAMGEAGRAVSVTFVGTAPEHVWPLAERAGVMDQVTVLPGVLYADSIAAQQTADVLLLMQWNNPREQGNVPGKFFEYLGARRPILCLGLEDGVPGTIMARHGAGFVINDPAAIADQLRAWLSEKAAHGHIAPLAKAVSDQFTRDKQNHRLETFLLELQRDPAPQPAAAAHDGDAPREAVTE